ncbi:hypothetical protein EW146_g4189 [Bondarzewia mesenterica]|uniref:Reverse transcriptase domain-containing protein n=1 Tax=Bondarzewia mesenterica TaxID=1095465 RepID=A0A4V3XF84_9AGAM|nr:hypothetical protein EW146_g4189 [Bondarzewia mesenterica]
MDLDIPLTLAREIRNWRLTDWDAFAKETEIRLGDFPPPQHITSTTQFTQAADNLIEALTDVIRTTVPISKPCSFSKCWWTSDLMTMRKEKQRLANLSYSLRHLPNHPSHQQVKDIRNAYATEIQRTKKQHWEDWLEDAKEKDMWIANKYISSPAGDGGRTRVPSLKTQLPDGTTRSLVTNSEKSAALASTFFPPPPETSSIDPDFIYPPPAFDFIPITCEQILCHLKHLQPYKAPGPDGIPNIVLMRSGDLVLEHLYYLYTATFELQIFYPPWRDSITVVLRKPSKSRYDVPKAYRPIALLNTTYKLLSAIVAEEITYIMEANNLVPATHFSGRPGRTTTNSMLLIVDKIKAAWRDHKIVSVLFLDIKGAFPNAVTERLLHNMRKRRINETYVLFIARLLQNRRTTLRFDDYTSDFIDLINGIGQGDLLSIILYLFYNADLLDVPRGPKESATSFVIDAAFIAVGKTFSETHKTLARMMKRAGGGIDWSKAHNSHFEDSKLALIDFSRRQDPDTVHPGKTTPAKCPPLTLPSVTIRPSTSVKFLGVYFDQELRWKPQVQHAIGKAMKWTLQLRRLSRASTGLPPIFVRRLYESVAVTKLSYAAPVWCVPIHIKGNGRRAGSIGIIKQLSKVQRLAALTFTGALLSTAQDVLNIHAFFLPVPLLIDKVCF